jgi:phosphohistidine phosphatase
VHIILIRHADAGDRDPATWPDDTTRPMSAKGAKRHRRALKRLRRADLIPSLLLASPWTRAWQTAELTASVLGSPAPVACPALADTPDLTALAGAIGPQPPDAIVALVGHEPWLGELAALLLTSDSGGLAVDLPKSGILGLEAAQFAAGAASLQFFWRPKG